MYENLVDSFFLFIVKLARRYTTLLIKGGIVALILPFIVLCFYAHPNQDDFTFASGWMNESLSDFIKFYYTHKFGRYSLIGFIALFNPLNYGWLAGVKFYFFASIVLFCLALFCFLKAFFGSSFKNTILFWTSLFIAGYFFTTLQELFGMIFWMCSNMYYFLGASCILFFLSGLLKYIYLQDRAQKIIWLMAIMLLTFLVIGFSEFYLISINLFFVFIIFSLFKGAKSFLNVYSLILMGMTILAADSLMFFAPGNTTRLSEYVKLSGEQFNIVHSLLRGGYNTALFLSNAIIKNPLLILTVLFIPVAAKLVTSDKIKSALNVHPVIPLSYTLLYVFISNAFFIYSTGGQILPGRSQGAVYFIFLIGWVYSIAALVRYLHDRNISLQFPEYLRYFLAPCMALLIFSGNVKNVYVDIFRDARVYNMELQSRYRQMNELKKSEGTGIIIPSLSLVPKSFSFGNELNPHHAYILDSMLILQTVNYFGIDHHRIIIVNKFREASLFGENKTREIFGPSF